MLALAYVLMVLLPIGGVAYVLWTYRRKMEQREAESAGRMQELLGVATVTRGAPEPGARDAAAPATAAAADAKPANPYVTRDRLLTPPQTLLYYLLRTGLPDHVVFAQMSVASLLDPSPALAAYAREEQARIFARHVVDFVVTDKSTRPLAAVKLVNGADNQMAVITTMRAWFGASGVRFVEIDAAALPRKEAIRALVLGDEAERAGAADTVASE